VGLEVVDAAWVAETPVGTVVYFLLQPLDHHLLPLRVFGTGDHGLEVGDTEGINHDGRSRS